jgi:hypothetical protein
MSFDYLDAQATADELIAEFGATVTLSTQAGASFDPITGAAITPSAPVSISGVGVKLQYKSGEIDGTTIVMGDCKYLLSTRQTPLIGMVVVLAGETWRVISADPLSPASGVIVLWTLQLRR